MVDLQGDEYYLLALGLVFAFGLGLAFASQASADELQFVCTPNPCAAGTSGQLTGNPQLQFDVIAKGGSSNTAITGTFDLALAVPNATLSVTVNGISPVFSNISWTTGSLFTSNDFPTLGRGPRCLTWGSYVRSPVFHFTSVHRKDGRSGTIQVRCKS